MIIIKSAQLEADEDNWSQPKDFTDVAMRRLQGKLAEMKDHAEKALLIMENLRENNPRIGYHEAIQTTEILRYYVEMLGLG